MDRSKRAIRTPKRFDDEAYEVRSKQQQLTPKQSKPPPEPVKPPVAEPVVQNKSIIKIKLNKVKPKPKIQPVVKVVKVAKVEPAPKPNPPVVEREPPAKVQRPRTKRPRTPPVYEDLIPNVVLPFWDARTAAEDHEDDNVKELVHCQCGVTEELGLMVQCETCLTWQHSHCLGIESPEDVSDGYTCKACSDSKFARESKRWAYDQEWLTKGKMKRFPCDLSQTPEEKIELLRQINQLIAESLRIHKLIHSLKVKSRILASASDDDPELRLFRAQWGATDVVGSSSNEAAPDDCRANLRLHIEQLEQHINAQVVNLEERVVTIEENLKDCKPDISTDSLKNDLKTIRKYIALTS